MDLRLGDWARDDFLTAGGVRSREGRGSGTGSRRLSVLTRGRARVPLPEVTLATCLVLSSSEEDSSSLGSLLGLRLAAGLERWVEERLSSISATLLRTDPAAGWYEVRLLPPVMY